MARKKRKNRDQKTTAARAAIRMPEVIELPPFSHKWGHYRLTEADRTIMLNAILNDAELAQIANEE